MAEVQDFEIVDASNIARWPEGMAPAAINNAARADEGILARWYADTDGSVTSSGSSNAYAVTSNRTMGALFDNLVMAWTANHTNDDTATLSLNGLTAKAIKRSNGDDLVAGDIASGQPVMVVYKSSPDEWRMLSAVAGSASDAGTGLLALATQALMEAAASLVTAVTPGRQHFHPGMAKARGRVTGSTGAIVGTSYNVASVVRTGEGRYTVTLTNAMADANYDVHVTPHFAILVLGVANVVSVDSSTVFKIATGVPGGDESFDLDFSFAVYGDMA